MSRHLIKILLFALMFVSCEKNDFDSNYPTTFRMVPSETLSQIRTSFSSKNKYLTTSLNEFGFCDYFGDPLTADIDKSTIGLKILPITADDKIELRVAWLINIPGPVYYKIYVDVMTGEIIGQEPTIIS
jgi:hypothetical protein